MIFGKISVLLLSMGSSVGKGYSAVNRAYLAGFFDADGAIMACIEKHAEKKFRFRVRLFIKITQKTPLVLEKFKQELGFGRIRLNRHVYDYDLQDQQLIYQFIDLITPYVFVKRPQLRLAKQILDTKIENLETLIQVAQLADTLSGYNVRSSTRRRNYTSKIQEYFSSND